ncbi:DUF134 domain-containing protein [Teredinibacter sp. KSP-S5-2]|uniref:DUF134 domain-containing protein n=1 Tax=Teredinibacter sp. KSP-S5-2 TaxID=3034506 RepID=UPI002934D20F|nr:DUF134 domain-containing protein [Teredinibacter sp. KSP-S5-2]WNO11516.1 DUF134 domain-containing protein [Teredinibacter sp. KSP-S5-2]
MVRPKKGRRIGCRPAFSCFKPNGVPLSQLDSVSLQADELEAIRLADLLNLNHQQAADEMAVSRQTFGNIVARARHKVAQSLVEGMALTIDPERLS